MNEEFPQNNKRIFNKIDEGGFVNVHEVSKKVSEEEYEKKGYILKEYRNKKDDTHVSSFNEEENATTEEVLEILRKRHAYAKECYKEMPDLVLRSRYFIGKGEDGEPTVYDVQKRISDFRPITGKVVSAKEWIEDNILNGLTNEQRDVLKQELLQFVKITRDSVSYEGNEIPEEYKEFDQCYLDFTEGNIVVTSDGHLRILDTNVFKNLHIPDDNLYDFHDTLEELESIAKLI